VCSETGQTPLRVDDANATLCYFHAIRRLGSATQDAGPRGRALGTLVPPFWLRTNKSLQKGMECDGAADWGGRGWLAPRRSTGLRIADANQDRTLHALGQNNVQPVKKPPATGPARPPHASVALPFLTVTLQAVDNQITMVTLRAYAGITECASDLEPAPARPEPVWLLLKKMSPVSLRSARPAYVKTTAEQRRGVGAAVFFFFGVQLVMDCEQACGMAAQRQAFFAQLARTRMPHSYADLRDSIRRRPSITRLPGTNTRLMKGRNRRWTG